MSTRQRIAAALVTALAVAGLLIPLRAVASDNGLKPGDMLDQQNWQAAEKLLPPEILKHYQDGGYANRIESWPADVYNWPKDFQEGSKTNVGKYKIGSKGEILDAATGKQPEYIIGFPFPNIDPAEPTAGVQTVWNFFYRTYYFGNLRAESQLNWMNPKALERRVDVNVYFMYYDGVPAAERPTNPQNYLYQQLVVVRSPADVNGTGSLSWRFRDPQKRDASWAYVPALRRVRAVSPANRSDGFLGSDMSQDDGPFFDGKPEDFDWKFKGEVEQLRIVDPLNLQGKSGNVWLPTGGWRANWPDTKFIGYMDKEWKGLAWAPKDAGLAKRRFYVVEGIPRDKYYLFGKLELYFDAISFQGSWNRKFDWRGELLNTLQVMAYNPHTLTRPDGKTDWVQGSNQAFQCTEAIKMNRATVAGIKSHPTSGFDGRLTFDKSLFDLDALARHGK
jgi:hypothetical protein